MSEIKLSFAIEDVRSNGEESAKFLVPTLMIDDREINDGFALDMRELANSCRSDGEYFILTCGCGEPGCAGIFEGITVSHHNGEVIWVVPEPLKSTPSLETDYVEYRFDRHIYTDAIRSGMDKGKNLLRYADEWIETGPQGFSPYDFMALDIKQSGLCSPRVNKALEFSAKAHSAQKRKGTDIPYISHPYAIGMILSNAGCSEDVIIAGILHDTVEDTEVTLEEITAEFGEMVAIIVDGCSEPDKTLSWEERKQHTLDELKHASQEIHYVACADKLHNISTMIEEQKIIGDALWQRFKRGKDQQSWYFHGLLDSLASGGLFCEPLYKEFKHAVETMFGRHDYDNAYTD